jgi:hypothetical protein
MIKQEKTILILGLAAIGLVYFGVLDPVLKFVGIKDDEETKKIDQVEVDPGTPWSINFWKNVPGATVLHRAYAVQLANTIYNSFGYFNDNEEQVKGAIKSLKFKTQLSFLAMVFYEIYNQDLLTFLRGGMWPQDRLSDNDLSELISFVNKLPLK